MVTRFRLVVAVVAAFSFWAAAVSADVGNWVGETNRTIADIIANDESLAPFYSAVEAATFADDIFGNPFVNLTVFAPAVAPEELFYDVNSDFLRGSRFLTDSSWIVHLRDIIDLHVFTEGSILSNQLDNTIDLVMRNGEQVHIHVADMATNFTALSSSKTEQALILESDIWATNGIVHKIDTTLLPIWYDRDLFNLAIALRLLWDDVNVGMELVFEAVKNGLQIFGMAITVFFPLDSAWLEIEPETLAFYRDPANVLALQELLQGHIATTVYPSVGANDGDVLTTLAGTQLLVSVLPNSTVMFNDATLDSRRDLLASDGLVHGIDKVFLPPPKPPTIAPSYFPPNATDSSSDPPSGAPENSQIPIDSNNQSVYRLSRGAVAGLSVGAVLILVTTAACTLYAAHRRGVKKRETPTFSVGFIQAVAVPAEEEAPSVPLESDVETQQPRIIEVLPPSGKDLPAFKDQVRGSIAESPRHNAELNPATAAGALSDHTGQRARDEILSEEELSC